jgi:hypothetical protein
VGAAAIAPAQTASVCRALHIIAQCKKALDCDGAEAQVAIVPAFGFIPKESSLAGPHEINEIMPSDSSSRMFAPLTACKD